MKNIKKTINRLKEACITASLMLPASAFASTSGEGLPWEDTLTKVSNSISGPVLLAISTVMFVITLAMAAFGEWEGGFQKFLKISCFLSACFGVSSFIAILFGGGAMV